MLAFYITNWYNILSLHNGTLPRGHPINMATL